MIWFNDFELYKCVMSGNNGCYVVIKYCLYLMLLLE